jgi:hypothetical protein
MSRFSDFFFQTKTKPHRSIYHAELSQYAKFHKKPLQTHENMGPQTCQPRPQGLLRFSKFSKSSRKKTLETKVANLPIFYKEMYAKRQRLARHTFLISNTFLSRWHREPIRVIGS